jgi:transposase
MRGQEEEQGKMFSYVSLEERVRRDHPVRAIRRMTDQALKEISEEFDELYSATGRPSIPPEKLLRALLIQMLYSVRSERLRMEEIERSLLCRWFVGLDQDEPVRVATVISKNRERLLEGDIATKFFRERDRASARPGIDVGRALQRGQHVDRGVGGREKFSAQAQAAGEGLRKPR